MSLNRWISKQVSVKQVDTITITAADVATTYKVTINGKVISTLGQATTALTAAALAAALNTATATEGEFARIVWTNPTAAPTTVVATAGTAGTPFTLTATVSGGAGTLSLTHTTPNQSPNDIADVLNWSLGVLPIAGDDVLVDFGGAAQSMLWNLQQFAAVAFNSFVRRKTAKGLRIGLSEINTDAQPFTEYLTTEFALNMQGTFLITIELAAGERAETVKINGGTTQTTLLIRGDAPGALYSEQVWFRGTHASNVVNLEGGSLAVAPVNHNAATVATANVKSGALRCGDNVTFTTLNNLGGTVELNNNITTVTQLGGSTMIKGSATVTTLTVNGGKVDYRSTGTITTASVGSNGTLDFSQDNRARTITNTVNIYAGGSYLDKAGTTLTCVIKTVNCGWDDCRIRLGPGHTFSISA
jgi:hypothetical protein